MKRVLILAIILLLAVAGIFAWWSMMTSPPTENNEAASVVITKGASAERIGNVLQEKGVIKSALAFKIYVQLKGVQGDIQAGEYEVAQNLTLSQVVDNLMGPPSQVWVTVPEGLRREEIAERFIDVLDLTGTQADNFRDEFLQLTEDKEGYLFPDTYLLPRSASAAKVVALMESTFSTRVDRELTQAFEAQGLSLEEAVILASLVEKETKTDEERPVVAGIMFNRLDNDWALDIDASVQYGVASRTCVPGTECDWWPILTKEDIQRETPYNTYQNPGLPPTPIANPGLSSLKAVANPTGSEYFFYIHEPDGTIHYAETLEEHNQNIQEYLR